MIATCISAHLMSHTNTRDNHMYSTGVPRLHFIGAEKSFIILDNSIHQSSDIDMLLLKICDIFDN